MNGEMMRQNTFDRDVLDSESKNDRPDHAKCHLQISINNFCRQKSNTIFHNNAQYKI